MALWHGCMYTVGVLGIGLHVARGGLVFPFKIKMFVPGRLKSIAGWEGGSGFFGVMGEQGLL